MSGGGGGSGSGGSGGRGGGGRGASGKQARCETLAITTVLISPAPIVLATLKPKDELHIEYDTLKGPFKAVTARGDVAGVLVMKEILELINCIEDGFIYRAIVKSISGGNCTVIIKA